jgi:hypothetical protein
MIIGGVLRRESLPFPAGCPLLLLSLSAGAFSPMHLIEYGLVTGSRHVFRFPEPSPRQESRSYREHFVKILVQSDGVTRGHDCPGHLGR